MNFITKNKQYSERDIKVIKYGLEGLLMFLEKLIIIVILGYFLNILEEMIIFMFFFMWIKTFSSGMHAGSSISCLILSASVFIIFPFISKYIVFSFDAKVVIAIVVFIIFMVYSPADTHKKPIKKNRSQLKILSLITVDFYCILCFFLNNRIGNIIILSLISQSFFITPIPYKIFKMPYENWKEI